MENGLVITDLLTHSLSYPKSRDAIGPFQIIRIQFYVHITKCCYCNASMHHVPFFHANYTHLQPSNKQHKSIFIHLLSILWSDYNNIQCILKYKCVVIYEDLHIFTNIFKGTFYHVCIESSKNFLSLEWRTLIFYKFPLQNFYLCLKFALFEVGGFEFLLIIGVIT